MGDPRDGLGVGRPGDPMFTLSGKQHAVAIPIKDAGSKGLAGSLKNSTHGEPGDPMYTIDQKGTHAVAYENHAQDSRITEHGDISPQLNAKARTGGGNLPLVMNLRGREGGAMPEMDEVASVRSAEGGSSRSYVADLAVRRLTPRECERLQGFPDDYTLIPWRGKPPELCPDGPRYRALGNSMAVPVMRWIGERIEMMNGVLEGA